MSKRIIKFKDVKVVDEKIVVTAEKNYYNEHEGQGEYTFVYNEKEKVWGFRPYGSFNYIPETLVFLVKVCKSIQGFRFVNKHEEELRKLIGGNKK